jgi:hypothetical protein
MDMTADDDKLLESFIQEAAHQTIEDNGFSQRVMHRLPSRSDRLARLWTVFCIALGIALFIFLRGGELLLTYIEVWVRTIPTMQLPQINLPVMLVTVATLLGVGIYELLNNERSSL